MILKPVVSVVMPVFNVEKYLKKSIDSVLAQDCENFELILIDDGSTDSSPMICDEYAERDNVSVYHIHNDGVANARNTGLKNAKGKYVAFFDSDDWVESDMLSKMLAAAEKESSDIVVCGFHMEYFENNRQLDYIVNTDAKSCTKDEFKDIFYENLKKNLLSTPWNKLYLKSFILENNVWFRNVLCEDIYFNLELFANISKISFISDAPYHWFRSRPGSETAKIYSPDLLWKTKKEVHGGVMQLCKKWNIYSEEYLKDINCYYTDRLVQCVQEIMSSKNLKYSLKRKYISDILNDAETVQALKIARPSSAMMKICYIPIKLKSVTLSSFMGWGIGFVKAHFSNIFYNIRSKEVNDSKATNV